MIISQPMRAVILGIWRKKISQSYISPNLVSDVAAEMNICLTSEQVTYISDQWNKGGYLGGGDMKRVSGQSKKQ